MIEQGYGRVLTRPGLSGPVRELIAVTVLAALGWERQLVSHLLGAVRLGATPAAIRRACRTGTRGGVPGAAAAAARAWRTAFGPEPAAPALIGRDRWIQRTVGSREARSHPTFRTRPLRCSAASWPAPRSIPWWRTRGPPSRESGSRTRNHEGGAAVDPSATCA
jgi:hypothetical protein